jgi:hypothetical protein
MKYVLTYERVVEGVPRDFREEFLVETDDEAIMATKDFIRQKRSEEKMSMLPATVRYYPKELVQFLGDYVTPRIVIQF